MKEVRILAATGMLGSGFKESSLKTGMSWRPDFIGCDSGSTDFGPYYLGSGESNFSTEALRRELTLLIKAGREAKIPVIIGSAGTAGADVHVDRIVKIVEEIGKTESLHFRLGVIKSEQDKGYLIKMLDEGRISPLANAPHLSQETILRSEHIVGMAGIESFMECMENGADVIISGRSSDTSIYAALPILRGINPGSVWHAAKILECGAACVKQRKYPDCMFGIVRDDEFIVEPPNPDYYCTPVSVASHMLYENSSPYELVEPSGIMNSKNAKYEGINDRSVRVSDSEFTPAQRYTIKLEGAEIAGYQSLIIGGVRDPLILKQLDTWLAGMRTVIEERVATVFGKEVLDRFSLDFRIYGANGVMGKLEPVKEIGHEVGIIIQITADTYELSVSLAKSVGHIAVHYPIPEWSGLITSLAYPYSPAEIYKGVVYRFNMNHVVQPKTPTEMFRIEYQEL